MPVKLTAVPVVLNVVHVPLEVNLYLRSYVTAPDTAVQDIVTVVDVILDAASPVGTLHVDPPVVVNDTVEEYALDPLAQFALTLTSYDVLAAKDVRLTDVPVVLNVDQVPLEVSLYLRSYVAAPLTAAHVILAELLVILPADSPEGTPQLAPPLVVNITEAL